MKILIGIIFLCIPPAFMCGKALSKAVPCIEHNPNDIHELSPRYENIPAHFSQTPPNGIKPNPAAIPEHDEQSHIARIHARPLPATPKGVLTTTTTRPSETDYTGMINTSPEETLSKIFNCMDSNTLSCSRLVCTRWNRIIDGDVIRKKVAPSVQRCMIPEDAPLSWNDYRSIYEIISSKENLWERYYRRLHPSPRSCFWKIIDPKTLPTLSQYRSYPRYVVSTYGDMERQILNLVGVGLPVVYLDMQPAIQIIEWYRLGRSQPVTYRGKVELLAEHGNVLATEVINVPVTIDLLTKWKIATSRVFRGYGSGLRTISFERQATGATLGSGLYISRN